MGNLSESAFLARIDAVLTAIEDGVEAAADAHDFDVDVARHGNVVEIRFEGGTQIIVNSQAAVQELWLAARAGGFHFRLDDEHRLWRDTRSGREFFALLSECVSAQAGVAVTIAGE